MATLKWLPALALLGCGDGLVEPGYVGAPIYSHPFFVISVNAPLPENPRWAVFWFPDGLATPDFDAPVEQPGSSRRLEASVGALNLFARPGDALLARTATGARYGIGRLFAYADTNNNRLRDPDEPLIGHDKYGLYYAPVDLSAADSPTGRPMPAGHHRIEFPVPCSRTLDGTDPDCAIPLGDRCRNGDQCSPGICLQTQGRGWPSGTCAAVEATGCAPIDAVFVEFDDAALSGAWVPGCSTNADCRSEYHCDQSWGTCMRDLGHEIILGNLPPERICAPLTSGPPAPDGGVPPADGGVPPPDDGGPPPEDDGGPPMVACETDADCVGAPGPQPQHCDREGICRPDRT